MNANISVSKDFLINHAGNNQARAFGRELTNVGRKGDFGNENGKIHNLKPSMLKDEVIIIGSQNNASTKMNIEPTKTMMEEAKDGQMNYMAKIAANDDLNLDPVDLEEINNPQYVSIYAKEIFDYLRSEESKYLPSHQYMTKVQTDINEKMRGILIDWLIDVHLKFKLVPETLYLTVNLIDRYLSHVAIPRQKLQLVGVSSMLIACKYEEIYPPEVKDFEYVTDKAYTREEILDMEGKMLHCFNFNLTMTSSYRFLERFARVCRFDERSFNLARYLLELALIEFKMIKYVPSNLACSAIYLVNKLEKREAWPDFMINHTKYNEMQLRAAAKDFCLLLQNSGKGNLQAVKRKFSSNKFLEVSKIQWDK